MSERSKIILKVAGFPGQIIPSLLQLPVPVVVSPCLGTFSCAGFLSSSVAIPWRRSSTMSSERRFDVRPDSTIGASFASALSARLFPSTARGPIPPALAAGMTASAKTNMLSSSPYLVTWMYCLAHRWALTVLHYPRNMVIYHYPLIGVIYMVILHVFIIKNYPNLSSNYYPKYKIRVNYPFILNFGEFIYEVTFPEN